MDKIIKVGVLGAWRGEAFAENAKHAGMELVAVCDTWRERLNEVCGKHKVAAYTDYDEFLGHDMDAVALANYFHEHAPFAIKALEAGKHVISETSACKTLGEGVRLARAVEKSGKIYMLAENYPYFAYNQEMRRLYLADEIGEVQYGEGEYNHPSDSYTLNWLSPGQNHWRNNIPATYYCSHALAPLMYITGTRPVCVNSLCIEPSKRDENRLHVRRTDPGSVIICRMDNGSVMRIMGIVMRGHSIWYRLHGTRGLMENLRTGDKNMLRIVHEEWDMRPGDVSEKIYKPEFPEYKEEAKAAGHAGGDFFTNYHFAKAIRSNEQPFFDVYKGIDMALAGILAYRSALEQGAPYEIPDFRNEAVREKYEDDEWSPLPDARGRRDGQPWPSVGGEIVPSEEAVAYARKVWGEMGYAGE